VSAEALALPANDHLWMGSGLGGELKQAGGEEIEVEAVRQGPAELGQAIATGAGSLPFQRLYHLVVMGQDLKVQAERVRAAIQAALRQANADRVTTLAIAPLLPDAQAGALHEVAKQLIAGLFEGLGEETSLQEITLTAPGGDASGAYREAFFAAISAGHG
jgi:O-acetyl-ADP-ribose deacetylase (regulator of RNase III)